MNKSEKLNLIDGIFLETDANEILMNIFLNKFHFHEKKNFSSQVRFGKDDEIALVRMPALKNEMDKILQIITAAKNLNKKLVIKADVYISYAED